MERTSPLSYSQTSVYILLPLPLLANLLVVKVIMILPPVFNPGYALELLGDLFKKATNAWVTPLLVMKHSDGKK